MRAAVMDVVIGGRDDTEVFARAKQIGCAGVEITVNRLDLRDPNAARLENLHRAKQTTGLEIHTLVLAEHNELGGLADQSADVADHARDDVRDAIVWAHELGAGVILVPFFMRSELESEADLDRAAGAFRPLCQAAGEHGVMLCYEGTLAAQEIHSLAVRVSSDAFGCYFDLANPLAKRGLDAPSEIRDLGGLVQRVHVKDTCVLPGDCRPGTGRVDFRECARALSQIGYDGWLTLETPPAPPPLISRDLSFVRNVFAGLDGGRPWPRLGAFSRDFAAGEWEQLGKTFACLGLELAQLDGALLDASLDDPASASEGRAVLESLGIHIPALGGYRNLIASKPDVRAANIDHLQRCLEISTTLGSYVVATETGTMSADGEWTDSPLNTTETAWSRLYDALELLLPVAERSGTILALEASVKHVLKTQEQVVELLRRYPTPHLQVVCDPYNYLSAELVPVHEEVTGLLLDRLEDRFVLAHLKDVVAGGAEAGTPEFGTGVFSQLPYLEFLRSRRPDLDLVVEHLPLAHVPDVRRRIDNLMTHDSQS
jgi:sugar phosphate isomerase/epimerase